MLITEVGLDEVRVNVTEFVELKVTPDGLLTGVRLNVPGPGCPRLART